MNVQCMQHCPPVGINMWEFRNSVHRLQQVRSASQQSVFLPQTSFFQTFLFSNHLHKPSRSAEQCFDNVCDWQRWHGPQGFDRHSSPSSHSMSTSTFDYCQGPGQQHQPIYYVTVHYLLGEKVQYIVFGLVNFSSKWLTVLLYQHALTQFTFVLLQPSLTLPLPST